MSQAMFANFSPRLSSPRLTQWQMVHCPLVKVQLSLEWRVLDQYCRSPGGLHDQHHQQTTSTLSHACCLPWHVQKTLKLYEWSLDSSIMFIPRTKEQTYTRNGSRRKRQKDHKNPKHSKTLKNEWTAKIQGLFNFLRVGFLWAKNHQSFREE